MNGNKMPSQIQGEWIWKNSLSKHPEAFLLMRKEFVCTSIDLETTLWISASSCYQLFINGRFVGFGPRAHQNCGSNYADLHEVTYYLESGINVIAVLVWRNFDPDGCNRHVAGLWCQMEASGKIILSSDRSWMIRDGGCFSAPRPRISPFQGKCQFFDAANCPLNWTTPVFLPDSDWGRPDLTTETGDFGSRVELHPLSPPGIEPEIRHPLPFQRGTLHDEPAWTQVVFENAEGGGMATYAAHSFLYQEEEAVLHVCVYSDDPLKFFCNNRLLLAADNAMGTALAIPLRPGWNRLLLVQNPERNSMGFVMLICPDDEEDGGREYWFSREPDKDASEGWRTAGPLKLSLEEATPSLKFERLVTEPYSPALSRLTDPFAYLSACAFEADLIPEEDEEAALAWCRPLRTGEFATYRLDMLRYGFVRVTLEATLGDIVDISIGSRMTENGFVSAGEGVRGTGTLRCRNAKNVYLTLVPSDCFYIMISVRSASAGVRILSMNFEELVRPERKETLFRCSDELLNNFWEIGRQTLRRSAAFIPLSESRSDNDCFLLDAYIDVVNMAAVFCDQDYASSRLQQFVDAQLENGDIPALAYGRRHVTQFHQLFFLPVWINYNYRFTGSAGELKKVIPNLDLAGEFFEAMIDEDTGVLADAISRFAFSSRISQGEFKEGETPTYINALYCRFLLSSAEIYRLVEEDAKAEHCMALAAQVADALQERNYDPVCSLFCRWSRESERVPDHNLFANFCAMYGGVLPLSTFEYFFNSFFSCEPPYDRSDESRHPYFHFLFMEMMFALRQKEWAFQYFRDYWSRRMCPETMAWRVDLEHDDPAPTKFSEGSCVSPNLFLLREVLGIRIAEPAHSVIYFDPAFKLVDWAEGVVAMTRGRLKVKWFVMEDGVLDVTLDSSVPVKVLPEMSSKQLANTVFRLGERVTLLSPSHSYDDGDE